MVIGKIIENINSFIKLTGLNETINKLNGKADKIIVINNSFLFREKIKTNKNSKYLAFTVEQLPVTKDNCYIVEGPDLRSDYKIQKKADKKILKITKIEDILQREILSLGDIVFVLMGEIDKGTEIRTSIDHSKYEEIVFSPGFTAKVGFDGKTININNLDSEDELWGEIEDLLISISTDQEEIDTLKGKIGKTFDYLKKEAYLNLIIPESLEDDKVYFLELIYKSIEEQVVIYKNSLNLLNTATVDRDKIFNEILRIAYNFADDAVTLLRLIISVCDLKPIILWNTFLLHYKLTESIKNLPWSKQGTKPSISKYIETIKKARNKSFHRLIPFSKAFEIKLPENSLKDINLRIFSEFGSKVNANKLEYKDKELIDVLMEFTRTSEEIVKEDYWKKNLDTMEYTIELLKETAETLRLLKKS